MASPIPPQTAYKYVLDATTSAAGFQMTVLKRPSSDFSHCPHSFCSQIIMTWIMDRNELDHICITADKTEFEDDSD